MEAKEKKMELKKKFKHMTKIFLKSVKTLNISYTQSVKMIHNMKHVRKEGWLTSHKKSENQESGKTF